ncbi:GFA family protein [Denitrobaculum tricleocarpae]|uniref:GFA family protein n=1 Tax=Denitrobaculum tricleocarpae TaxID=2591009 RepID=A0A545TTS8_9PROT|nr:GFA family protein [Denitrobaculum tricleocarpae]TQV80551.1 GFA family protein [Denitrobaculum tricleocarpae]
MHLEGSCHCRAVTFSVESAHPVPYMRCYCSVCRKTGGGGGYAINLGATHNSLSLQGKENIRVYQAMIEDPQTGKTSKSPAERSFCGLCGTALWVWDSRWPELLHPFASAIDSDLPAAPSHNHIMLEFKASWVPLERAENDACFDAYPDESLADWHERMGLAAQVDN